jgi:hypothetical protein
MAQRSNRRFLNLISEVVITDRLDYIGRERADSIMVGSQLTPTKAEYIGPDLLGHPAFRLQLCGGPYRPIMPHNSRITRPPLAHCAAGF